jgi:hypothetical protein
VLPEVTSAAVRTKIAELQSISVRHISGWTALEGHKGQQLSAFGAVSLYQARIPPGEWFEITPEAVSTIATWNTLVIELSSVVRDVTAAEEVLADTTIGMDLRKQYEVEYSLAMRRLEVLHSKVTSMSGLLTAAASK